MNSKLSGAALLLAGSLLFSACNNEGEGEDPKDTSKNGGLGPAAMSSPTKDNTLTEAEQKEGWQLLFDGKTLNGWRMYQSKPADCWGVQDGAIYCKGSATDKSDLRADLVTADQFENFELSIDWKKRKSEGKWKDTPEYGMEKTGNICLQDHGSGVWFKNIKIRKM